MATIGAVDNTARNEEKPNQNVHLLRGDQRDPARSMNMVTTGSESDISDRREQEFIMISPVHTTTVATTGAVDNTAESEEKSKITEVKNLNEKKSLERRSNINRGEDQDNHLLRRGLTKIAVGSESDSEPVGHLPDRKGQGLVMDERQFNSISCSTSCHWKRNSEFNPRQPDGRRATTGTSCDV